MNWMKKLSITLGALLLAAVVAFGWQTARAVQLERTVEAIRQQAFYSLMDGLQDVELNLSKLLVSATPRQGAILLSRVAMQAGEAQESLAQMPLQGEVIQASAKFVNQLADYSRTLTADVADGRTFTDDDLAQLEALMSHSALLNNQLREMVDTVSSSYWTSTEESQAPPLVNAMDTESVAEYPTLIYDGPFSDGRQEGQARGLDSRVYTAEEALQRAIDYVGKDQVTLSARTSDTGGPVASYGFVLDTNDGRLTVHVTQKGGAILWMIPETANYEATLSLEDCVGRALSFLSSHGYGEMEPSYYQQYDGLAVVNFASVQDDVLLYPDLVKVQVRMDTGAIVGIEANNYLMNHTQRTLSKPELSLEDARDMVSARLSITQEQLCIIPHGQEELLCYEFVGTWADSEFLIYIDALSGREVEILKIIDAENGRLTA